MKNDIHPTETALNTKTIQWLVMINFLPPESVSMPETVDINPHNVTAARGAAGEIFD